MHCLFVTWHFKSKHGTECCAREQLHRLQEMKSIQMVKKYKDSKGRSRVARGLLYFLTNSEKNNDEIYRNMLSTCPWWTICGLEDWTSRCQLFETWLVFLGRRPITDFLTSLPLAVLIESHLAIIDDLFRPPNVCIYCCIFRGRHVKFQNDSLKESPVHIPKPFRSSCKIPKRRR